jgi:very-short-patch-repair endonuclease
MFMAKDQKQANWRRAVLSAKVAAIIHCRFYSPKAKLVIELDGGQHFETDYQIKDQQRDAQLVANGLKILRFDNRQVLMETEAVLLVIYAEVVAGLNENQ